MNAYLSVISGSVKTLWGNPVIRYLIIGLVVVVALLFSLHLYGNGRYEDGIAYQKSKQEEEQRQLKEDYQKRLDAANLDRSRLNEQIAKQKEDYAKLQNSRQQKSNEIQTGVNNYAQTDNGSKRCLDPKWMQLYQDSLPE